MKTLALASRSRGTIWMRRLNSGTSISSLSLISPAPSEISNSSRSVSRRTTSSGGSSSYRPETPIRFAVRRASGPRSPARSNAGYTEQTPRGLHSLSGCAYHGRKSRISSRPRSGRRNGLPRSRRRRHAGVSRDRTPKSGRPVPRNGVCTRQYETSFHSCVPLSFD